MKRNAAIQELKTVLLEAHREKYPDFPDSYRYVGTFTEKNSNGLTKCILAWLRAKGHHAERVNTTGMPLTFIAWYKQFVNNTVFQKSENSANK